MKTTLSTGSRRGLLRLLAVTAGIWGLSGPIASSAWAQAKGTGQPLAQLRIGYQKSAVNLVILKQQGALEKIFPGTEIKWLDFPAGPQLLEALIWDLNSFAGGRDLPDDVSGLIFDYRGPDYRGSG